MITDVQRATSREQGGFAAWLTIERLLYLGALLLAAGMRFWALGRAPLNPLELGNTWPAWIAAQGQGPVDAGSPVSAIHYSLQWFVFWLGANGDGAARVTSAVAGSLMTLVPWAWRGWLGRVAALALAYLIAFDPWLTAFSRLADGAGIGLVSGVFALVALSRVVTAGDTGSEAGGERGMSWRTVAAAATGVLLSSGVMAWSLLPVVAAFVILYRRELATGGLFRMRYLAWLIGAAVLMATLGLVRLDAVPLIAASLSLWVSQFTGIALPYGLGIGLGMYGPEWPWIRLVVDMPLAVLGLVGLAAEALMRRRGRELPGLRWQWLLWGWLAWGVVLWLLPGRTPYVLPIVGLPLLIGAAQLLQRVATRVPQVDEWREVAAVAGTLAVLIVSGTFWAAALGASRTLDPVMVQATAGIVVLSVGILVAFAIWSSRSAATLVAVVVICLLLALATFRSGWQLNQLNGYMRPNGLFARETHPEIRLLAADMENLSALRTGDPHELAVEAEATSMQAGDEVIPAAPDPALGWYLRAMRNLTWGPSGSAQSGTDGGGQRLLVTHATATDGGQESGSDGAGSALPEGYVGSPYSIELRWQPSTVLVPEGNQGSEGDLPLLWQAWLQPAWRWLVHRQVVTAPDTRDVVLWAPAGE
jgi:hypothetical protein